ncbi:MAG: macro domain-containing protein [Erysipelotrichaceae bacterium]|nr:macro domain-containing protein [Erysipelotrichaceae bacterium]
MPLEISRNDISTIYVDAIVNPTDSFLSGSGGVDKTVHELAGKKLDEECARIRFLSDGSAIITDSYGLNNCKYIIHTCGPKYINGEFKEAQILASCYRECLKLAEEYKVTSIAFPLIASGSFGFPKGQALKIATDTITEFLLENEMMVYLLVYDNESFDTANRLYCNIHVYLDENLYKVKRPDYGKLDALGKYGVKAKKAEAHASYFEMDEEPVEEISLEDHMDSILQGIDYNNIFEPDESFSECLIRMIDEKGLLDPDVYKKANIDRKHFNHIKNTKEYRPRKETVVALAIGMKLDLKETNILLERAGFVLSRSSKFDLIIRYCIEHGIYDIYQINEILFTEDQKTLGC